MKADLNEYYKSIKAPEEMRERALSMRKRPIARILTAAASFFLVMAMGFSAFGLTHAEVLLLHSSNASPSVLKGEYALTFSVLSLGETTLKASSGSLLWEGAEGTEITVSGFAAVSWMPEQKENSFNLSVSKGETVVNYTLCYAEGQWNIEKLLKGV